jgi:hypothetical protein
MIVKRVQAAASRHNFNAYKAWKTVLRRTIEVPNKRISASARSRTRHAVAGRHPRLFFGKFQVDH